jgi:LemA protein
MDLVAPALALAGFIFLALLAFYAVSAHNGLVLARQNVAKAWGNIDVLLCQRHDELPPLVEVCKGAAKHEASTLERVAELRTRYAGAADSGAKAAVENELNVVLVGLLARVEAYPDLKANESFLKLQQRITGIEDAIAARREFFNESVRVYNTQCEQLPSSIVAGWRGFTPHAFLEAPAGHREPLKTDLKG